MNKIVFYILLISITLFGSSQQDRIDVGIDEQLGDYLPMELEFYNSNGNTVTLDEVIDRPTLLALVYYECPSICSPLLTEVAWVVDRVDLVPKDDFQVLTVSIDHNETPELAANWKKNYMHGITRPFPEDAWTFLTGDSVNIRKLTDAVGYYFKSVNDKEYLHPGAVIAISPDGKISRYIFGDTYNQFDIKMALIDAESGKTSPTIAKVLQLCFSYDPEGRGYTLNVTRIVGGIMLLGIVGLFAILTIKKKSKKN